MGSKVFPHEVQGFAQFFHSAKAAGLAAKRRFARRNQ
jgi:hypothetical protein